MVKFNKDNQGHMTKHYPPFMGPELGVVDTVNIQYPELERLYQEQLSQIWNEFEIDLTQDRLDMKTQPKDTVDLMVKTIMWQTVADSVASRSILETLGKWVSNSELMNLLTIWSFFEVIHARAYSHIIKQTFVDPNEMLEQLYQENEVLARSKVIVETFERMAELTPDDDPEVVKKQIILTVTALMALEAIAFMSSFAVTFAITETGTFQGIGKEVALICRDEVLHTRMDFEILKILQKDPEWSLLIKKYASEIKSILDSIMRQELSWPDYLFSEGRAVIGLNANLLKEYTLYMGKPLYDALGIPFDFEVVDRQPLPYMEKYIDSKKMQGANQEIQNIAYKVGAVRDDTDGLDLGEFDDL